MGGTDVSVDDPAFWSKVGFVAKKASAANLGERKRKAVERMGMGEEWVDDEAEDEAEGATKMLTMLQKVGVRRASELPVLSRQPQFTAADATSFAHGAVLACAAALGAAADFLGVAYATFEEALTSRTMQSMSKSIYKIPLKASEAVRRAAAA